MNRLQAYLLGFVALLCFGPSNAMAQAACISPGVIIEIRSTGTLSAADIPEVTIEFSKSGTSVEANVISSTSSRLRIQVPSVGLEPNEMFKIRGTNAGGKSSVLANLKTCDFTTVDTGSDVLENNDTRSANGNVGPLQSASRSEVAAPSGAPEFILMGSADQVSRAEAIAIQSGAAVLRRRNLSGLNMGMAMIDPQGNLSVSSLQSALARSDIDVAVGSHHVYTTSQGVPNAYARELTMGSSSANCRLDTPIRIGIIDGPVDTNHPALRSARIEVSTVLGRRDRQASPDHATGLAGLIAGEGYGLAEGVQLFSVSAVSRAGTRELAKLESIAAALDQLASRNVAIINMSLAGPSNDALARAIQETSRRGVIMVASVGNDRNAPVAYPASDPNVIGVTAIDANKQLYRHASRGSEVDFAAPGVDVRVPIGRNRSSFQSGTSYASAALTALIAIELAKNGGDMNSIMRSLTAKAEDLGNSGPDPEFGFGLARSNGC